MKISVLFFLALCPLTIYAQKKKLSPEEKKEAKIQAALEKPYNPLSLTLPSKELLARMGAPRVMDMGATAYAQGFYGKALYFYKSIFELYPEDTESVTWAHYESAFIYYKRWQNKTALSHLADLFTIPGADPVALKLAQILASKINNPKEYKAYMKQEDIIFAKDLKDKKKANAQIAKEEAIRSRAQSTVAKERKKREKAEAAAAKALIKEEQKKEKEADKKTLKEITK